MIYMASTVMNKGIDMQRPINANVIIKSPGEQVAFRGNATAAQAEVGDYMPDLDTIVQTARYFHEAGFQVTPRNNYLTISGLPGKFEEMFGINLFGGSGVACIGNFTIPDMLDDVLIRVVFPGEWAEAS